MPRAKLAYVMDFNKLDARDIMTDGVVRATFDDATMSRAADYVPFVETASMDVKKDAQSVMVNALVAGTRTQPYQVIFEVYATDVELYSGHVAIRAVCSCPVGIACKHAAALALALRNIGDDGRDNTWQQRLQALTSALSTSGPNPEHESFALQFTLAAHRFRSDVVLPGVRPMRPGKKQNWVKSGANWTKIPALAAGRALPADQAAALHGLYNALVSNRVYLFDGVVPSLESFGARLPLLLREAEAAGIAFITDDTLALVSVRDDPVRLAATTSRDAQNATLQLGVTDGHELWHTERLHVLGRAEPSVVALLDDGHLQIADLNSAIPGTVAKLMDEPPLEIPVDELDSYRDLLSGLVPHVTIWSPDGTVDVPERATPTLLATVTWTRVASAQFDWTWSYGDTLQCPRDSNDPLGGVRNHPAEQSVLATIPEHLINTTDFDGGDALSLAIHDLPYLRGLDNVDVVEHYRPDFREAPEGPQVSFDLAGDVTEAPATTDWLDLQVTITVCGETVPLADVLSSLTLGDEHIVLPSGMYLPTDRPEFDSLRDIVAAACQLHEADHGNISVGKHDLGLWAQLADLGIVSQQAEAWVQRARALRDLTEIPQPDASGLTSDLRGYQQEGFWWLAFLYQHKLGGILADDMGLGKTLQVLALIQHARALGGTDPFLVVAPTSVITAWKSEAQKHTPGLRLGAVSRRSDDVGAIAEQSDIVVTSYTMLRLERETFAARRWEGLILDEAQQVKNHHGKTYAAVRQVDADFRLAMTGTPFENRLMELWALLSLTVPGIYPWPKEFKAHVARPVENDGDTRVLNSFRRRIRPFMLRRTKDLVAGDLPEKQEQVVDVALTTKHRKIYETHLAKERQKILGLVDDFDRNRIAIFSALTKLRQLALDPALIGEDASAGSAKLDLLLEQLSEITGEGHKVLVFSQFTSYLQRVQDRLVCAGMRTTYLDGQTQNRGSVIDEFRSGEATVFLISLKAGGSGLTLTEADYVFMLDPWWNPAVEAQAVDRAHRIGQNRPVHVYRLVARDTIEQKVMELKERKAGLFAQVIDGDAALANAVSADDIRELFDA